MAIMENNAFKGDLEGGVGLNLMKGELPKAKIKTAPNQILVEFLFYCLIMVQLLFLISLFLIFCCCNTCLFLGFHFIGTKPFFFKSTAARLFKYIHPIRP